MATLKAKEKEFIILELACFERPVEVIRQVEEVYGKKLSTSQIAYYDPTTIEGQKLAKKWKELFKLTRYNYLEKITNHPIANKVYRLGEYQRIYDRAMAKKNYDLVLKVLVLAAKEVGGMFENGKVAPSNTYRKSNQDFIKKLDEIYSKN